MIESIWAHLRDNIWWEVAAVLLGQAIYVIVTPLEEKYKINKIKSELEADVENKFAGKRKKIWALKILQPLFEAVFWFFSFFFGWTKSEDKTIQEKLNARSRAFKNVLADNYEIGIHTHAVKSVRDLSPEALHTAYRFSVVDLFVEKAIVILEKQARPYKLFGVLATVTATVIILVGMALASVQSGIAYEACRAILVNG